ncbi:hypothetical protein HX792_28400 [Pseudomonas sp. B6002]|uniref:hypothetical protein n=1 Tax=Pseudomonas sp. B6002 TaxID=2726978 RepID=UPI0015A3D559|nr:hypothetical protein [Pseudomonas sp. B6002]NVZ54280.1 hypothetical protein [Pseudomonas sp. B6002]
MTHDQNSLPATTCSCTSTDLTSDQTQPPAVPCGCVPIVQRRKPGRKPGGRLPDRPDPGGCPPGFHRPPSSRQPFAALYPYIPNLTPIVGTDGALNNAALTVSALGVIYILYAWLEQAENDFVWVELNGLEVKSYTVSETDAALGKDITLNIESVRFIDQANNTLQGFVRRLSGVVEETTLLNVWVDTKAPGGLDPQASTPTINENLARPRFEDPTIEAFGIITQAAAQLGIKVIIDDYPVNPLVDQVYHRKEGDVIFISIGGVIVTHTVTSFEASGNAPIVITINYGIWLQVTPGVNILEWYVRDKAGNQSHGFSIPRLIQSNVGGGTGPLLPEPYVLESDYDGGSDEDFIDTDAQLSDLNTEISIRNYGWALNDQVLVTYLGLTSTGEPLKHIETADIPQPNALRIYVPLPLEFAKKLAGGRLLITYERVRVGEANTPSNAVVYSMRGTPVDNSRPAPVVKGLVGGVLPVDTDPVEITVPFFGQDPSDKVDLIIEGKALDGTPVYAKYTEIAGTGDLDYFLDYSSVFAPLEGSSFKAYYVVNDDTTRPSKSVVVQVGDIAVTLPPPTSPEAPPPDHVFDELVSKGNLKALVHPHSSIALNDEVRVVAIGSKPGGSITTAWLKVTSTWFNSPLPFTIARAIVLANKEGTMTLHWEVRTLPTDTPLKSLPLIVNVGAMLQITDCPSLLESTFVSPCVTQLNPLNVWTPSPRIVTFRVKYLMQPTDLVTLVVQGKPGLGMPSIPSKPGVPDAGHDYITFAYGSDFVAAYLGEPFTAHAEVQRNGNVIESPKLTVNVDALSEQTLELVSVPEAVGGVITASGTNNVRVTQWPFFKAGQAVFIFLENTSGNLTLRDGTVVSPSEYTVGYTSNPIPQSFLNSLEDGSTLTIKGYLSLDGTQDISAAIALKEVTYIVSAPVFITPSVTKINTPKKAISLSGYTSWTSVTVVIESEPNKEVEVLDGGILKSKKMADANGISTHPLSSLSRTSHSITARGVYGDNPVSAPHQFTITQPLAAGTITRAVNENLGGVYVPPGGSAVRYSVIAFEGTCSAFPVSRAVSLGSPSGGFLNFTIYANQTTWSAKSSQAVIMFKDYYLNEEEEPFTASNNYPINWT